MKIKARDLVDGWPKSRSISSHVPGPADLVWHRFSLRVDLMAGFAVPDAHQWLDDQRESLAELKAAVAYHQAQQRMLDRHFSAWRRPLNEWEMRAIRRPISGEPHGGIITRPIYNGVDPQVGGFPNADDYLAVTSRVLPSDDSENGDTSRPDESVPSRHRSAAASRL